MSDIRDMLGESINRVLSESVDRKLLLEAEADRWPEALWKTVEDGGFASVLAPEDDGGSGGGWADAYPILRAIGYYRAPLPLAETIVGRNLIGRAGLRSVDGILTLLQQQAGDGLELAMTGGQLIVSGRATSVPWARHAGHLVLAGEAAGEAVLAVLPMAQSGIAVENGRNIAGEPRDKVTFDGAKSCALARIGGRMPATPVLLYGALARAASIVGAAECALDQSVQYATERVQFGRPIAKFQAIQHQLAALAADVTAAATIVQAACEAALRPDPRFEIAVAKIRAGDAAGSAPRISHQVHGAMGMTYDHTLHFATRRLWAWRAEFGAESAWAEEVGAAVIRRGGGNFWQDLTARGAVAAG